MARRATLTPRAAQRARVQQATAYRRAVRQLDRSRHANERFPQVEAPAAGRVMLVSDEPPSSVTLLVAEQADTDGGVGGWDEVDRDQRTPAILFGGVPRASTSLSLILDRDELKLYDEGGVQGRINRLYAMGRPDETTGEPARIKLLGEVPTYNPLWVMDTLKATVQHKTPDGVIQQATVAIALSEWVDSSLAVTLPLSATRSTKGTQKARYYVTRNGDTLRRVALIQLGTQAQWKTLLANNKKALKGSDPDALLRPGIRLLLSTRAAAPKAKKK